jgi:RHS repeat-associated protein
MKLRFLLYISVLLSSVSYAQLGGGSSGGGGTTYYYYDGDGDGWGSPTAPYITYPSSGYVTNNLDCNDNDATLNPTTRWYRDNDNDNFGDPNNWIIQCTQPTGYIRNNTDCNDSNSTLNPNTRWYQDADSDGFGNPGSTLTQCSQPTGYVTSSGDCNDADNTLNPNTLWYADSDGDGFGNAAQALTQCSAPANYVRDNTDCNDSSASLHPNTLWYQDQDGDGFGDPNNILTQCPQPAGYVSNNSDNCPAAPGTNLGCNEDVYIPVTPSTDQNYIFTQVPQKAMTQINATTVVNNADLIEQIQYFDGLGRPTQQIGIKQSPDHNDMITYVDYDPFGRQTKQYLPYKATGNRGSYRTNSQPDAIKSYYKQAYPDDFANIATANTNPYSESLLENSPLNRVQKQAAPGEAWKMGNGHEIEFNYQNNASGEVRLFEVSFSGGNTEQPSLSGDGSQYYLPRQLTKTVTKDENHDGSSTKLHTTEEFKDKQGRVVLKRTYAILNGTVEAHDTYYVYDDFGNLTYVLPPKVDTRNGVSPTELSELSYQYKYDHRNRLVEKKIPGKAVEYIVYNQLDQPVLTQDVNLRQQNKWLYTKYDAFGRVVQTGFYTFTGSRQALITDMQNYYNSGTNKLYEQKTGNSYTNQSYPIANTQLLTENYYDTYNFDLSDFTLPPNTITNVQGLAVGSKVKVLTTSHWITTLMGYDAKGRVIWTGSYNSYLDTRDEAQTQYDFPGKVLQTTTTHTKGSNAPIAVTERFTYDHAGRLTRHTHQIGNGPEELLAQNTYDETGQLVRKNVGNTLSSPLQQVDYQYNIRGWLKEINDVNSPGSDLFSFKIGYNEGANALYNGNISSTRWRTNNTDNSLKSYDYSYDALNRITDATDNLDRYSLKDVAYDKNGNILRLTRKGAIVDNPVAANSSHFGTMDILTYHYDGSSNRLRKVTDAAPIDKYGFKDDAVNTSADPTNDYYYDSNGNMLSDTNKGIGVSAHIAYNHLNLPTQVSLPNGTISYIYDAGGMKLKKIVNNTTESSLTTTEYAGNYIYEDGNLQFFNTAEGYIEPVISTSGEIISFDYIYQYKDHLGNIRLFYSDADGNGTITQAEIREENNYYPFGLQHKGYNNVVSANANSVAQKYRYNGKEIQDELGLNMYDYGARFYEPATGRWFSIDAMAEKYYDQSTYTYTLNNPILYIDPDGNQVAMCCWDEIKDFIFNDTGKSKPVLTLGLHHIKLPMAERTEGDSAGNVLKAMWNGVAGTWNDGMEGKDMGQITDEGMAAMGDMARRVENGEATTEDFENMTAGVGMMFLRGKVKGRNRAKVDRRGKIKNGPEFSDLKDHAKRHSEFGGGDATKYYNSAVEHLGTAQHKIKVTHDGKTKYNHISSMGNGNYKFTSSNKSGSRIYTHMKVNAQYLKNKGITLPEE